MVPPLIPHCFDHVWNLKRLSIIILVSRRNEEREKKKERKKINKKESSSSPGRVRVIIERGTRHLPVKSTHVAARGWKILEPIFDQSSLTRIFYVLNSRHYAFQWPTNYARGTRGASVPENRKER